MDDALWLQVSIPRNALDGFLNGAPFNGEALAVDSGATIPFESFFARAPVRYRGGQFPLPDARVLNILIDEGDETNAMIYLMWHET